MDAVGVLGCSDFFVSDWLPFFVEARLESGDTTLLKSAFGEDSSIFFYLGEFSWGKFPAPTDTFTSLLPRFFNFSISLSMSCSVMAFRKGLYFLMMSSAYFATALASLMKAWSSQLSVLGCSFKSLSTKNFDSWQLWQAAGSFSLIGEGLGKSWSSARISMYLIILNLLEPWNMTKYFLFSILSLINV